MLAREVRADGDALYVLQRVSARPDLRLPKEAVRVANDRPYTHSFKRILTLAMSEAGSVRHVSGLCAIFQYAVKAHTIYFHLQRIQSGLSPSFVYACYTNILLDKDSRLDSGM